jgi:tetratricopeptide (TPR) repeat protein
VDEPALPRYQDSNASLSCWPIFGAYLSVGIAQLLTSRDRFADVVTVLADVAPRRDDAEVYMLLGYSLGMQGRRAEGLALLERARDMQPTNWWPHYALGWVYAAGADYGRAVMSLQKAVELRPGLYDAEREIQRLRPLVSRARTPSS